jgi:hypothetical protein
MSITSFLQFTSLSDLVLQSAILTTILRPFSRSFIHLHDNFPVIITTLPFLQLSFDYSSSIFPLITTTSNTMAISKVAFEVEIQERELNNRGRLVELKTHVSIAFSQHFSSPVI